MDLLQYWSTNLKHLWEILLVTLGAASTVYYSFARSVKAKPGSQLPKLEFLQALSTQFVANTQFFRISAVHPDPLVTQSIANAAPEALIVESIVRQQLAEFQATLKNEHG